MPMQSHAQFVCVITLITCVLVVIVTTDGIGMHEWSLVHAELLHIPYQGNCRCKLSAHLLHPPCCRARHAALHSTVMGYPPVGAWCRHQGARTGRWEQAVGSCTRLCCSDACPCCGMPPALDGELAAGARWCRWGATTSALCLEAGLPPNAFCKAVCSAKHAGAQREGTASSYPRKQGQIGVVPPH